MRAVESKQTKNKRPSQTIRLDADYTRMIQQRLSSSVSCLPRCCIKQVDERYLVPLDSPDVISARKIFLEQFLAEAIARLQQIDNTMNAGCLRGQISRAQTSHNSARIWGWFCVLLGIAILGSIPVAYVFRDPLEYESDDWDGHNYRRNGQSNTFSGSVAIYVVAPLILLCVCCVVRGCCKKQSRRPAFVASAAVQLNPSDSSILTQLQGFLKSIKKPDDLEMGQIEVKAAAAEPAQHELPQQLIRQCKDLLALLKQCHDVNGVEHKQKGGATLGRTPSRSRPTPGLTVSHSLLHAFGGGKSSSSRNYHTLNDTDDVDLFEQGMVPLSQSVQQQQVHSQQKVQFVNQAYLLCKQSFFPTLGKGYDQGVGVGQAEAGAEEGVPHAFSVNNHQDG